MSSYTVELEPEVEQWLAGLSDDDFAQAAQAIDRLQAEGHRLRMPFSRSLGEGLLELRFSCADVARRITYWFAPGDRIVLLTTFRKQRRRERAAIEHARRGLRRCQTDHVEADHE